MSKKVRDVMTPQAECIGENETLVAAAEKMARLDAGVLPICGEDNRLKGMLTDRDIVVKALAKGKDSASTHAGELAEGTPITIGADDSVEDAQRTMIEHKVRRLPVLEGHDLVGVVSQGDLAVALGDKQAGELVGQISQ
jgi:CBS domain-containing protein